MAAQLFHVVIIFSWLVLTGFHDCHQIHMNHPFSCNTSWMTAKNGWPDGFHGSLDVLFLLICSPKVAAFSGLVCYMCSHLWWVLTWITAPNSRAEATFFSLWCQLFLFNKMNQAIGVAFRIMGCFFHQSLDLQCRTHALFHDSQRTEANYNSDFTENGTLLCGFPWEAT